MRKLLIMTAVLASLWSGPAWAWFESNEELVAAARITLEEAVKNALVAMPGKAVEAEIKKKDGLVVYEIEILDTENKSRTVCVNAQSGETIKIK